jgi:hypothetical protein
MKYNFVREYYAYMENNILNKVKDFIDNADKKLPIIILDENNNEYELGFIPVEKRNENGELHYQINIIKKSN